tara:strand:+ start:414 stop:1433 length:1020 start_codon:yes stop_codon:yes gene_type:complete
MSKKNSIAKSLKHKIFNNEKIFSLFKNFKKNISFLGNNNFLIALSGGPDSLALSAFARLHQLQNNLKVHYALVDHGIRKGSAKEAAKVGKILKKIKVNIVVLKNNKVIKKNLQGEAREIRYNLLSKFCKKKKVKYLLTGHNSDDQIETFLIRLSRGSGVQGLSSMQKKTKLKTNIKLIRPLLDFKKKDLVFASKKIFGTYIKDPSNLDKKFLRTKVRILKDLMVNYGLSHESIIKSINNLGSTKNTINSYTEKIHKVIVQKKNSKIRIHLEKFLNEEEEIQFRILSRVFKDFAKSYYPPRSKKIINIINQINKREVLKLSLSGCLITRTKKQLIIEHAV